MEKLPNTENNPVREKVNEIIDFLNKETATPEEVSNTEPGESHPEWSNSQPPVNGKWRKHHDSEKSNLLINRQGIQWLIKNLNEELLEEIKEDMGDSESDRLRNEIEELSKKSE